VARKRRGKRVSNGVKRIIQYLESKKIDFKTELRFPDCRDKLPLPFDFAIFRGIELIGLIEYNGIQHYKPIRRFRGKKGLIKQQNHDMIKVAFCAKNTIPLLVISYEIEEIEGKIQEFLDII
jgi:hypothetical protein